MCGIVGKVHADIQRPIDERTVRSNRPSRARRGWIFC